MFRRGNIVDIRRLAIAVSTILPLILLAGCAGRGVTVASHGVTVPNVVGLPTEKAAGRVRAVGLVPSVICQVDRREGDIAIAQEPLGGTMAAKAAKVKITGGAQTCERPKVPSIPTTMTYASGLVPALQTHNPTVAVTPAAGLFDDQQVLVTVTGFGIGGKVSLSECATASDANSLGCGHGLPVQTSLSTDNNGGGSAAFQLQSSASAQPSNLNDIQPCTNNCVLVATVGGNYGFAYTALHFGGSAPPNCTTAQLHVSAGKTVTTTGHSGFPLLFSNTSSHECRLSGYPGVAGLDADGRQVIQAQRETSGFFGGLPGYSGGPIPAIGLAPGETTSAFVEGDDVQLNDAAPCLPFAAMLVTPPNAVQSVRVEVAMPGCSDLQVQPVVLGIAGQG